MEAKRTIAILGVPSKRNAFYLGPLSPGFLWYAKLENGSKRTLGDSFLYIYIYSFSKHPITQIISLKVTLVEHRSSFTCLFVHANLSECVEIGGANDHSCVFKQVPFNQLPLYWWFGILTPVAFEANWEGSPLTSKLSNQTAKGKLI